MENNQKWVNLSYVAAALLVSTVAYLLALKFSAFLDVEGHIRSLDLYLKGGALVVGAGVFLTLYKSTVASTFMNEVVSELGKVTWPTQDETVKATIAVLIAVVIAGVILWLVDLLWIYVIGLVL